MKSGGIKVDVEPFEMISCPYFCMTKFNWRLEITGVDHDVVDWESV